MYANSNIQKNFRKIRKIVKTEEKYWIRLAYGS